MKNIVTYARSNSNDEMDNLALQAEACRVYAEQNGYQVTGCYTDTASGTSVAAERPGWKALLEACRKGDVQCVIAVSASRISRSRQGLYDCLAQLKETGVEIVFTEGEAL